MMVTRTERTVGTVVDVDLTRTVTVGVGLDVGIVATKTAAEAEVSACRFTRHHVVVITLILREVVRTVRVERVTLVRYLPERVGCIVRVSRPIPPK